MHKVSANILQSPFEQRLPRTPGGAVGEIGAEGGRTLSCHIDTARLIHGTYLWDLGGGGRRLAVSGRLLGGSDTLKRFKRLAGVI